MYHTLIQVHLFEVIKKQHKVSCTEYNVQLPPSVKYNVTGKPWQRAYKFTSHY